MEVHISKIRLVYKSMSPIKRLDSVVLFEDCDGNEVVDGDIVKFYKEGEFLPTSGYATNLNGLCITTFNNIINKWQYYTITF